MSGPPDAIRRRDEILQVLYWMRGEGLGGQVALEEIRRLLAEDGAAELAGDLEALAGAGLVQRAADGRYGLTDAGVAEGGKRFYDEFSDYLRQGHGACSDPNCDCHQLGPDACVHAGGHGHPD